VIDGSEITLEPAAMRTSTDNLVELSGRWELETEIAEFHLATKGLPLPALRAAIENLPNVPQVVALEPCSEGEIRGELRLERRSQGAESTAAWHGDLELERAVCSIAGAADLQVERAAVSIRGAQWSVRKAAGQWGELPFRADMDHSAAALRPFRINLTLQKVDSAALGSFFKPALRRPLSFLERTFRSRAAVPGWLAARRVEGTLRAAQLEMGGIEASNVIARFYWDGPKIEVPDVTAATAAGQFSGRWQVLLGGETARSRLVGRADGLHGGEGVFDAELDASWQGFDAALLETLQAQGHVTGRIIDLPEQPLRMVQACVEYDGRKGRDRLKISCLEGYSQGELLDGSALYTDSKWVLDFTGPRRQFRLLGTFSPMEWTLEPRSR
jgi:hypothetical protein